LVSFDYTPKLVCLTPRCPDIPSDIIWKLVTSNAIPINMPATTRPISGKTITAIANMMESIPTLILKNFDQLLPCLSLIPWMILDIPSTSNAIPNNSTTNTLASMGYAKAINEIIITIMPKPMLANRDLPDLIKPLITFSIPANSNRKARKMITEIAPKMGLIRTKIDRINIMIPRPIWTARNQVGDFSLLIQNDASLVCYLNGNNFVLLQLI
jgi:hypothetical protein